MEELTKAQQDRAAFEAAMGKLHPEWSFASDGCGGYHAHYTECAWQAWQARSLSSGVATALEELLGPEDDPRIGWSGRNGTNEVFACEFCGATHGDCTQIQHTERCFITKARAALATSPTEGGVRVPLRMLKESEAAPVFHRNIGHAWAYTKPQRDYAEALIRKFCEVNGLSLSAEAPQGGSNHG